MKKYSIFLVCVFLTLSCAKPVAPTGGEKDTDPPGVTKSKPPDRSVNFSGKRIEIEFTEYLTLKNISQELLVSPPLKNKPVVKLRDKVMIVQLEDTLRKNSTYTFDFGNSITDLHEGNILKNYKFSFSTGPEIDSLYFKGKVFDAFTHQPLKGISVMAYREFSDSTPYFSIPDYVARSIDDGSFVLSNISAGKYHVFALKDINQNHKFDNPREEIAFYDSIINPDFELIAHADTFKIMDTIVNNDTIYHDSITHYSRWEVKSLVNLFLFQELYEKQYIENNKTLSPGKIFIQFKKPLLEKPEINFKHKDVKFVPAFYSRRDSIQIWLSDTNFWYTDSLQMYLSYKYTNISFDTITSTDTITLKALPKTDSATIKYLNTKLDINLNIKNNSQVDLSQSIFIQSENPIISFSTDSIRFELLNPDSSYSVLNFKIIVSEANPCKLTVETLLPENSQLKLIIPKGSITDLYNRVNDSLEISFKTKKLESYGTIKFKFENHSSDYIVQLLDEKFKIIKEIKIGTENIADLKNITPGKYKFRLIQDSNNNGKWDTGHFVTRHQPEKIWIFNQLVEMKANWDYEFNWKLE